MTLMNMAWPREAATPLTNTTQGVEVGTVTHTTQVVEVATMTHTTQVADVSIETKPTQLLDAWTETNSTQVVGVGVGTKTTHVSEAAAETEAIRVVEVGVGTKTTQVSEAAAETEAIRVAEAGTATESVRFKTVSTMTDGWRATTKDSWTLTRRFKPVISRSTQSPAVIVSEAATTTSTAPPSVRTERGVMTDSTELDKETMTETMTETTASVSCQTTAGLSTTERCLTNGAGRKPELEITRAFRVEEAPLGVSSSSDGGESGRGTLLQDCRSCEKIGEASEAGAPASEAEGKLRIIIRVKIGKGLNASVI